jgi:hypothetical protein
MTNYEYLLNLENEGKLKRLILSGVITATILNYFTIYKLYLYEEAHNRSKMDAIENVCTTYKTNINTIYRSIKMMRYDI